MGEKLFVSTNTNAISITRHLHAGCAFRTLFEHPRNPKRHRALHTTASSLTVSAMNAPTTPPPAQSDRESSAPPLEKILTHDYLMWSADTSSFEKAHSVADIEIVDQSSTHVEALVTAPGENKHRVTIDAVNVATVATAAPTCTCPIGQQWCMHSVAVALRLCPDVKDPAKPWLDRERIFRRFLKKASQQELVEMLSSMWDAYAPVNDTLMMPATFRVGNQKEIGKLMSAMVRDLIARTGATRFHSGASATDDALRRCYVDWQKLIASFHRSFATGRAARTLPAIERMVDALLILAERDEQYVVLLKQAAFVHICYCSIFDVTSSHLVSWLEDNIVAIDSYLPRTDFSYYARFVAATHLATAQKRAVAAHDKVLTAHFSLMANDPEPYRALLAERGDWYTLACHYIVSGQPDKAREIIAQAQNPDSGVTIAPDELAVLIRLTPVTE